MVINKLIFLDIDGVINHNVWFDWVYENPKFLKDGGNKNIDPAAVEKIVNLCDTVGAKIVLSSSWRWWGLGSTIKQLYGIRDLRPILDRLVGTTPRTDSRERGEEIKYFLNACKEQNFYTADGNELSDGRFEIAQFPHYVIFDDDCDMLNEQKPYLIQINDEVGITDDDIKTAIDILNNEYT